MTFVIYLLKWRIMTSEGISFTLSWQCYTQIRNVALRRCVCTQSSLKTSLIFVAVIVEKTC